jgi:hypothetical protein
MRAFKSEITLKINGDCLLPPTCGKSQGHCVSGFVEEGAGGYEEGNLKGRASIQERRYFESLAFAAFFLRVKG